MSKIMKGIGTQARMPLKTIRQGSSIMAHKIGFLGYVRADIAKYFIFPRTFALALYGACDALYFKFILSRFPVNRLI
jgi:hypothetical protein